MANAIDVAAYILEQTGSVTTMKLQKLVYYAQVRYLVMNGRSLFEDRIEADWVRTVRLTLLVTRKKLLPYMW